MRDPKEAVKELIDKAAKQTEAHHAMNYAQAALNAAHAMQVLQETELQNKVTK